MQTLFQGEIVRRKQALLVNFHACTQSSSFAHKQVLYNGPPVMVTLGAAQQPAPFLHLVQPRRR
jgi:hypothetical protein